MKKTIGFALCALFALQAGARTLYVDAARPNNNGNGLSVKKAKKTLQAAINVSKKGDTILVLQGTYTAPLKTNDKKIKIKSKAGAAKTSICSKKRLDKYSLDLGKGNATSVAGFTVSKTGYHSVGGVRGGSISNCTLVELGNTYAVKWTISNSRLANCVLDHCTADTFGNFITGSTLNRCTMDGSGWKKGKVASTKFSNTLVFGTENVSLVSCVIANCTVADNSKFAMKSTKAYNTIFYKVGAAQFKKSKKNTLKSCYKGSNPKFVGISWVEVSEDDDYDDVEEYWDHEDDWSDDDDDWDDDDWDDDYNVKRKYYKKVPDYHLAKGSPCLDKGTKAKAAKKLYGKKDLDGKKRVKGKSVDIGCYEY